MKLVSSHSSRVVAAFNSDDVRPETGIIPGDFINGIKERYKFLVVPDLAELNKQNFRTIPFRGGGLVAGRNNIEILELSIFEGGIVIDTNSSDSCELVLEDIIAWAMTTFGFRNPRPSLKLVFLSSVIVEFDEGISTRMDSFAQISSILSDALKAENRIEARFDYSKIAFNCDPALLPQGAMRTEVLIERRASIPYSSNRFFCHGPFRTQKLADLLGQIEQLLLQG